MRPFNPWKLWPLWREISLFLLAGVGGIWAWLRARQAQSWPSAQGRVSGTVARPANDRNFKRWLGELTYTYLVNGEYYSGFHRIRAYRQKRAEELIAGWKDRMVIVRYSPTQPDVSVLLKSDQPGGGLGS